MKDADSLGQNMGNYSKKEVEKLTFVHIGRSTYKGKKDNLGVVRDVWFKE